MQALPISIKVDDGIIFTRNHGEGGASVIWKSKDSLIKQIYFRLNGKTNHFNFPQLISNDHIFGFLETKSGILGFGGISHLSIEEGYVVRIFRGENGWNSKRLFCTNGVVYAIKEIENGFSVYIHNQWINYEYSLLLKKYYLDENFFPDCTPGDIQNIINNFIPISAVFCFGCGTIIPSRKDSIRCGPCNQLFCRKCWATHQWSHGRAPAIGINYTSHGTFSGYDGTEPLKRG